MTNPQDPNPPQDPAEPQNPYGTPPPPPPAQPSYGEPPAAPSYGEPPAAPSYGEPQAPPPPPPTQPPGYGDQPPAYGQPAQPYAQPAQPYAQPAPYGQPGAPYGQPGAFPVGPTGPEPASRGLAIASLVLGIIGCLVITAIVSLVLGIVALIQGRDGRNHGKGMAIAGIVLSVLWLIGWVALIATGVAIGSKYSSINDLDSGTCITAKGLADSGDSVTDIKKVGCSSSHDGEVLATHDLSASEASSYGGDEANTLCKAAVTSAGKLDLVVGKINVIGLTESRSPSSGDTLACVAFNSDGSKLTSKLG